jgi:hypothetical protein
MIANHSTEPEGPAVVEDDSEDTLVRPRFDEEAVRQAKPAVPLTVRTKPNWSRALFFVALLAGLSGGILGSILTVRYLSRDQQTASSAEPGSKPQDPSSPVGAGSGGESAPVESAQGSENQPPETSKANRKEGAPETGSSSSADLQAPIPPRDLAAEEAAEEATDGANPDEDGKELRQSFNSWLEATNQRDIEKQMRFYNSRVNRYYRTRGASPEAVRAEKSRVFGRADTVSVEAGEPSVTLSPDGKQATMRFRKRYNIEGEGVDRRGEVIQELRWQRVNGRWRIVGERDVKVVR